MMRSVKRIGFLGIAATLAISATSALADKITDSTADAPPENKLRNAPYENLPPAADVPASALLTEEAAKAAIARSEKSQSRSPAALDGIGEDLISGDLKTLRKALTTYSGPEGLDDVIGVYGDEKRYAALAPDAKWVAIQLAMYKGWKSFLFRIRPFVENKNARAVHSVLLTTLRSGYSVARVGYPSPQWREGAQFVAQPMKGMGPTVQNASDFQKMLQEWEGIYDTALARLNALDLSKPIVFDNQILYGQGAFKDGIHRYLWVGEAERLGFLSALYSSYATLDMMLAYSWEDILNVGQSVGATAGFEQVRIWSDVQGSPAKQRVEKINAFKKFGTLLPNGSSYMAKAWTNIQSGSTAANAAWEALKHRPNGESQFLDAEWWKQSATLTDKNVKLMGDLARGATVPLVSMVTGETVNVNLRAFFRNPPADLKAFLPNRFIDESTGALDGAPCKTPACSKNIGGQKYTFRNWDYGRAVAWNPGAYSPYFPDAGSDAKAPGKIIRVTSQASGAGTLGWFFGFVGL